MCHSPSSKLLSMASSTALPPAWMHTCSNAVLKSGTDRQPIAAAALRAMREAAKRSCSEKGRTSGPSAVRLALRASPATAMRSFDSATPTNPSPSSSWNTQRCATSSAPWWVRTVWRSSYLARRRSPPRLVRSTAAPPIRKRQLVISIDLLFPLYQLSVITSMLTTRAYFLRCSTAWRSFLARSMEMSPALQPMPPRL
nr:unnamed protein product [Digitaria exilis]